LQAIILQYHIKRFKMRIISRAPLIRLKGYSRKFAMLDLV